MKRPASISAIPAWAAATTSSSSTRAFFDQAEHRIFQECSRTRCPALGDLPFDGRLKFVGKLNRTHETSYGQTSTPEDDLGEIAEPDQHTRDMA